MFGMSVCLYNFNNSDEGSKTPKCVNLRTIYGIEGEKKKKKNRLLTHCGRLVTAESQF